MRSAENDDQKIGKQGDVGRRLFAPGAKPLCFFLLAVFRATRQLTEEAKNQCLYSDKTFEVTCGKTIPWCTLRKVKKKGTS
jgi:hypothetical protein